MQISPAATSFSQAALNSSQLLSMAAMPAVSCAAFEAHSLSTWWMIVGTATHWPA